MAVRKWEATTDICQQMNRELEIHEVRQRFRRSMETGNVLFCCVDRIEVRGLIWNAVQDRVEFFCDGRMNSEVVRVLSVSNSGSRMHYPSTLFSPEEVHTGSCTAKTTIFTANITAGLMVEQFSRWLRGLPVDPDIQFNLLSLELTVFTS